MNIDPSLTAPSYFDQIIIYLHLYCFSINNCTTFDHSLTGRIFFYFLNNFHFVLVYKVECHFCVGGEAAHYLVFGVACLTCHACMFIDIIFSNFLMVFNDLLFYLLALVLWIYSLSLRKWGKRLWFINWAACFYET